jgi:hypothetical protein
VRREKSKMITKEKRKMEDEGKDQGGKREKETVFRESRR